LKQALSKDKDRILDYLRQNMQDCLYIYADIFAYGLDNPNMKVWVEESDDNLTAVVMKYYESLQIYSDSNGFNEEKLVPIIKKYSDSTVFTTRTIADNLLRIFHGKFIVEYGSVLESKRFPEVRNRKLIFAATEEDIPEIVELLTQDPLWDMSRDILSAQLLERMRTGMGRSFIIRDEDGHIVCHVATFAEAPGMAVAGGLYCVPEFRDMSYTASLHSFLTDLLINKEKRRVFMRMVDPLLIKAFVGMRNPVVGEYARLAPIL
jgi:hypothetical protein